MADTHEEQLLSELLSSIARDDERLEAAHLESRVMATLDASPAPRFRPNMTHVVIAAAVVMAVLVPGIAWVVREVPHGCGRDACRAAPADGRRHTGRICSAVCPRATHDPPCAFAAHDTRETHARRARGLL